jgi:WD40 repeat protein/GTPase SAR1 family protein
MDNPKLFISYSHDSPAHADRVLSLFNRLCSDGIDCMIDQYNPAPTSGWPLWMEEQIQSANFVLMVCTEIYYKRVHKKDDPDKGFGVCWEAGLIYTLLYKAKMENTKFIPVIFDKNDQQYIPLPLQGSTYYFLSDEYDNLYRHLTNQFPEKPFLGNVKQLPHLPRRTNFFDSPFMVPNLPVRFVPRPKLYQSLLYLLLSDNQQSPNPISIVLYGAGGYGKTTLAAAICHDAKVRQRFSDGILWVTLGTKPKLLESLTILYFTLTCELPGFKDINEASEYLALALANKNCLLVIDDVWESSILKPFLRGGPNCVRLLTTRSFALACEEKHIEVEQMIPDESVKLLSGQQANKVADWRPFYTLATRLGEWPLLLELAGKVFHYRMECGDTLENAIQYLNMIYEQKGILAFDAKNATERNQAVANTITVSLGLLDTSERQYYMELAIFPEDTEVPFVTISQLWGLSLYETEEVLQRFYNLALLKLNLGNKTIRLHDELHFYLNAQPIDFVEIHQKLIVAWGNLDQLSDEYSWQHLAYHLIKSKQPEKLKQLLCNPLWLKHKLVNTDINRLIMDFDFFQADENLGYIQRALQLSAHILAKDPSQFVSQIYGRLMGIQCNVIQGMLKEIERENQNTPWLRSMSPCLISPYSPLISTLIGHSSYVYGIAVTPDGHRVISASKDMTLKVWDLKTGRELCTLVGHLNEVDEVAVTPDGHKAVSASWDKTLKVWDLDSGRELFKLVGHSNVVTGVAVTPDGRRVVSASWDKTLKVWNLESGRELCTLTGHSQIVNGVAITPDGHWIISSSDDNTLKVWDLESGQELYTLDGHSDTTNKVTVTPDGRRAVSTSNDNTLKVWDLKSGKELHTLIGHSRRVYGVAVTPDGCRVISASMDNTLKVWDLESGRELRTLIGHSSRVRGVTVTPDGRRAVSASEDNTLKIWDIELCEEISTIVGHSSRIHGVAVTPDGRRAVSASKDYTLKVWDLELCEELSTLIGHSDEVIWMAVTTDGSRVVSASDDTTLKVWDLESGRALHTLSGHSGSVNGVAITPDGHRVISASDDRTLKIWDLESGMELCTLTGHSDMITEVVITMNGCLAVSSSDDTTLKVWDLESYQELYTLKGHSDIINNVEVTSDGKRAVSISWDNTLKVWELESGLELYTLTGHSDIIINVAVTLDNHRAVSASWDNTLKIWDLESGRELNVLVGHSSVVNWVVVTPDSLRAVSVSEDKTLKIWDIETGNCISTFTGEGAFSCCAVANDGKTIVAGDNTGRIYFLNFEGI